MYYIHFSTICILSWFYVLKALREPKADLTVILQLAFEKAKRADLKVLNN